jgi:ABC-type glycerol-3-phosphate transport system substrate-binding protein
MPWDVEPAGVWYRSDILAAAGLESDPAKLAARVMSWDDWLRMAHELKQKRPQSVLISDPASDVFSPLLEQQGYGWIDGSKVVVVEKATKPAEMAVDVRRRDLDANVLSGSQWVESISNGAIAGVVASSSTQGLAQRDFPQTRGKWRVIPAPGGSLSTGGTFLTIPEQSPNKGAAWEFVKYVCCTSEGSNTLLRTSGIFPAYQPAWRDRLYDEPVDFFGGQAVFRLWAGIAAKLPTATLSPHDSEIDGIVFEELRNALNKTKEPAQAMKDAQATVLQRFPGLTG